MRFDPARWPNAVTIGDLIDRGIPLGIHCRKCGHYRSADAGTMPLVRGEIVPALGGRFRCSTCGSRETEARPDYARPGERLTGYTRL